MGRDDQKDKEHPKQFLVFSCSWAAQALEIGGMCYIWGASNIPSLGEISQQEGLKDSRGVKGTLNRLYSIAEANAFIGQGHVERML